MTIYPGFLDREAVEALAAGEGTRLTQILLRFDGCRVICSAQDVDHIASAIVGSGDYLRDMSIPSAR